jgi:hypothetical protein
VTDLLSICPLAAGDHRVLSRQPLKGLKAQRLPVLPGALAAA